MRRLFIDTVVLAMALAAPLTRDLDDETCEPDWVNPVENGSASSPVLSGKNASYGGDVAVRQESAIVPSADNTTISMPTRPDGSAGLPVDNDHLSAPTDTRPVPEGAAVYTPSGNTINCSDFNSWMTAHRTANLASKYLKVAPGTYSYDLGTPHALDADAKLYPDNNIILWLFSGGWTLDLRNVTFLISITPENANRRPADMIYVDESDDLTILGGTVWIDQGEQFSQARLTSLTPSTSGNQRATFTVEKSYNISAWAAAGPGNQGCVDTSSSTHFTRPPCNFWKVDEYDFTSLSNSHTFSATLLSGSALQRDYVKSAPTASRPSSAAKNNANLHVQGHDDQLCPGPQSDSVVNGRPRFRTVIT